MRLVSDVHGLQPGSDCTSSGRLQGSISRLAIEALNWRVLDRPKEPIETTKLECPADSEALQHMPQEERDALYTQLMEAEAVLED